MQHFEQLGVIDTGLAGKLGFGYLPARQLGSDFIGTQDMRLLVGDYLFIDAD